MRLRNNFHQSLENVNMYRSVAFLFAALLCHRVPYCTGTKPYPESRKDLAKYLMEESLRLHAEHCGYISLCTLPGQDIEMNLDENRQPCCHRCSCDVDCDVIGECCPDYQLYRIRGNAVFSNISETILAMDEAGLFDQIDEVENIRAFDRHTNCVNAELEHKIGLPRGSGYNMVTSCPIGKFDENGTEIVIKQKCETNDEDLEHVVPVFSHADKRTYKNLHCLECNGQTLADVTYWDITLTCATTTLVLRKYFDSPNAVTEGVKSGELSQCNVVFEPGNGIDASKCTVVNVASCPSRQHESLHETRFKDVCKYMYNFLPVDQQNGLRTVTYRNIGCFFCNNPALSFNENCKNRTATNMVHLRLNTFAPRSVNFSYNTILDMDDKFGVCKKGYVYDNETSACRQVICPRLMYAQNGSCVPLYTSIKPVYYSLMTRATFSKSTKFIQAIQSISNMTAFTKESEKALSKAVQETLEDNEELFDFDFSIFADVENFRDRSRGALYFISVKFWYPGFGGEYRAGINQGQRILTSLSKMRYGSSLGMMPFRLNLHPYVISGKPVITERVKGLVSTAASNTATLVYNHKNRQLRMTEVTLSESSFCYRATLRYGEFRMTRTHYTVLRTNKNVYPMDFDTESQTNLPVACLNNIIKSYDQELFKTPDFDRTETVLESLSKDDSWRQQATIEIASIACSSALVVILVAIAMLRKRYIRTRRQSS